jgi:MinD superfamily P-loop ATPase
MNASVPGKEIVVISGKGGTGKTSLTAALASCYTSKVLADCDVDAADLNLLLNAHAYQVFPFVSGHVASIDLERCRACGRCAQVCRFDAIHKVRGGFAIDNPGCEGCGVCRTVCPANAIEWKESLCGNWIVAQTSQGTLVHARLFPGAENSGKLVTLVREQARLHAQREGARWILCDGPPGIGCPVIASVTGAAAVLVVTEPTPAGLHDMGRVLELTGFFRVPAYVVINKSDLHAGLVAQSRVVARDHGAQVLAEIPYSPLFTAAQLQGKSIMDAFPHSAEADRIRALAHQLQDELEG